MILSPSKSRKTLQQKRILEEINGLLSSGDWNVGDILPSVRDLADKFEVGSATIQRVMQVLEKRNVVIKKRGYGTLLSRLPEEAENDDEDLSLEPLPSSNSRQVLKLGNVDYKSAKKDVWEKVIEGFHRKHPDIEIRMERTQHSNELFSAPLPDVIINANWICKKLDQQKQLLDLRAWEGKITTPENIPRTYFEDYRVSRHFCVPFVTHMLVVYVNKNLVPSEDLAELKRDWSFSRLVKWAGSNRDLPHPLRALSLNRSPILFEVCGFNTLELIQRKTAHRELKEVFKHLGDWNQSYPLYPDKDLGHHYLIDEFKHFLKGERAFLSNFTYLACELEEQADFEWEMLPLPTMTPSKRMRTDVCVCLPRTCVAPRAGIAFVNHLLSPEIQNLLAKQYNGIMPGASELAPENPFSKLTGLLDQSQAFGHDDADLALQISRITAEGINQFLFDHGDSRKAIDHIDSSLREICIAFERHDLIGL